MDMGFLKKQSIGFYLSTLTIIAAVIGAAMYLGNCKTAYFANLGVNNSVVACLVIAVLLEIAFVAGNEFAGSKFILDLCPVVSAVLITVATILFISTRVNGIAAIMTFTNNASTMQDLNNTIMTIVCCVAAMLLSMVSSFFDIVKEQKSE